MIEAEEETPQTQKKAYSYPPKVLRVVPLFSLVGFAVGGLGLITAPFTPGGFRIAPPAKRPSVRA